MRFAEPFKNPFSSSERIAQSEPQPQAPAAVSAMPTAPVQAQALPPVQSAPVSRVASAPVAGGTAGWSAAGGTRITVGGSDSLAAISQRYGVPASAILSANGLSGANQVVAGSQIVIPVYNAGGGQTQVAAAPQPASQPKFRLVEGPKPAGQKTAEATEGSRSRVRPGMTAAKVETAPAQKVAAAPVAAPVAVQKPAAVQTAQQLQPQPQVVAAAPVQPVKPAPAPAPVAAPAPQPAPQEVAKAPAPEPEQTGAIGGEFRWPARGRVIAGFGANGGNEGINIALPEGTPVKAAEAGTVTYAGSEVKGYGNLVLIRHDNGYVTAYAHNGDLSVKRGERVKRGQVIATSGQSGNVTSPQLHFEIRKGQAPVDPIKYLSGS
ncbi:MAG TPA: peptidoglycan DD-metalloendopeptidase family protein [Microvirga sp.]|jgi:murein DD-endopeptidase MepM/ murein hydrolase activator NlpD